MRFDEATRLPKNVHWLADAVRILALLDVLSALLWALLGFADVIFWWAAVSAIVVSLSSGFALYIAAIVVDCAIYSARMAWANAERLEQVERADAEHRATQERLLKRVDAVRTLLVSQATADAANPE